MPCQAGWSAVDKIDALDVSETRAAASPWLFSETRRTNEWQRHERVHLWTEQLLAFPRSQ
ncbi:hypothetical protein PT974_11661 [Cladobotryum mycophilum]|uniref:Uncharacterized protein n=1 Tax=Cladobotryum mycophilum TaxID=491253 RepID=A0ABR0S6C2_9HYPO